MNRYSQAKLKTPLYGLILTGGKSSRMGKDKANLEFHGKKQSEYCCELLAPFCEKIFISNRKEQTDLEEQKERPQIHDTAPFAGIGPLGGILSAMTLYSEASWLVLACDLPLVNAKTIEHLIKHRNPQKMATAFISTHDGLPEPLCAVYEAKSRDHLVMFLKEGIECPRKILINSDVELLKQPDTMTLENINTPEDLERVLKILS